MKASGEDQRRLESTEGFSLSKVDTEWVPELKNMVCLPHIFTYVRFVSHKRYFKVPLVLSLHCLWSCSWGLESPVTVSLEVRVPGRFHLNHPPIKYFLPLSYLVVISCDQGRCIRLCETRLWKQRGMTLTAAPRRDPRGCQRCPVHHRGSSLSTSLSPGPTGSLILLGNGNSHCSLKTVVEFLENVPFYIFIPRLSPLCQATLPIFPWMNSSGS